MGNVIFIAPGTPYFVDACTSLFQWNQLATTNSRGASWGRSWGWLEVEHRRPNRKPSRIWWRGVSCTCYLLGLAAASFTKVSPFTEKLMAGKTFYEKRKNRFPLQVSRKLYGGTRGAEIQPTLWSGWLGMCEVLYPGQSGSALVQLMHARKLSCTDFYDSYVSYISFTSNQ